MKKMNFTEYVFTEDIDDFCVKARKKNRFLFDVDITTVHKAFKNTKDGEYITVKRSFKKYIRLPIVIGWLILVPFTLLANCIMVSATSILESYEDGMTREVIKSIKSIPNFLREG